MLSGETAAGAYPVEAVQTMVKIAERTEIDINYRRRFNELGTEAITDVTNAISHGNLYDRYGSECGAIISVTKSGRTARMISKFPANLPDYCLYHVPGGMASAESFLGSSAFDH